MKFLGVAASFALASTAAAAPSWADWMTASTLSCPDSVCSVDTSPQQSDAEDITNSFINILNHPDIDASNPTTQALLGDNFFERSDSIDPLASFPADRKLVV